MQFDIKDLWLDQITQSVIGTRLVKQQLCHFIANMENSTHNLLTIVKLLGYIIYQI